MKTLIVSIIGFLVCSNYVYFTAQAADYPSSTTTPLAVDLDFNSKKMSNIGDVITKGPWKDVRAYGAVGDGVTNDATAFANAAAALTSGGTLFIPPGTYLVNAQTAPLSNTTIRGARGSVMKVGTGMAADQSVFSFSGKSRVAIVELEFDLNGRGTRAAEFISCTDVLVDSVYVRNGNSGIDAAYTEFRIRQSTLVKILNSEFKEIWQVGGSSNSQVFFIGNDVHDTYNSGIIFGQFETGPVSSELLISNNRVKAAKWGIDFGNSVLVTVTGNQVYNFADGPGIYGEAANNLANKFIVIADNIVKGGTGATSGIVVNEQVSATLGQSIIIKGNQVDGNARCGIQVKNAIDVLVSGNIVSGNGWTGVSLESIGRHIVKANSFFANAAVDTSQAQIAIVNSNDGVVSGNVCNANNVGTKGIVEIGTSNGNTYTDNRILNATTPLTVLGATRIIANNLGYKNYNSGATSVADGGTITHGLAATPTKVRVTPTIAGQMASVTMISSTTFTVALKTHTGTAGTTQTVYWEAEF